MDPATLAGTTTGFILAFAFLTHILIQYEDFLDDRKLYVGSAFGFISAVIAYLVEQLGIFGFSVENVDKDASFAFISIFGIALLHTALKGMSLNHKSIREGKDRNIAFYGASFGFIFGAVYVTVIISKVLTAGEIAGDSEAHILYPLLFLLSLGIILFQGSTGLIMGWGVAQDRLYNYFIRISLLHMFMNLFFFLSAVGLTPFYLTVFLVVSYGSLLYVYSYREVLPSSLTKEQRKMLFPSGRPVSRQLSHVSKTRDSSKK